MGQTGVVFFGLLVGFIVFITGRGELQAYLYVLGLAAAPAGLTTGAGAVATVAGAVQKVTS